MGGEHLRERASGCGRAWGRRASGTRHCPGGRNWTGTGTVGVGLCGRRALGEDGALNGCAVQAIGLP